MFPEFNLQADDGNTYTLKSVADTAKVLIYFYPKDNTPGCSVQATTFTSLKDEFQKKDVTVVGVSGDSLSSHQKFVNAKDLKIRLLVDENNELAKKLDVWGEKKNYGKTYMGIIRSTFLVERETGEILNEWRNVRAKGHAERVLELV